jgi:hypothetical protein
MSVATKATATLPVAPPSHAQRVAGRRADAVARLFARATVVALVVLISCEVVGGALRFFLVKLGVEFAAYLPVLLSAGLAAVYFAHQGLVSRLDVRVAAIIGFFVAHAIYSVINGASGGSLILVRVGFALYIWTPFFLGMMLSCQAAEMPLVRGAPFWWAVATAGVFINRFVHFPWTGTTFEVLGHQSEVARDWTTNGLERLAGFSRASFTAAHEITVFGILLARSPALSWIVRAAIWLLSVAAVVLTTSKLPLAALLLVPLALWIQRPPQGDDGQRRDRRFYLAMATLAGLMAAMVLLPASAMTQELLLKYSPDDVGFLTLSSMVDRATTMWPGAFALIADDHSWLEWLLGRGLGGIGQAQSISEPDANAADNLFVYLYVTFGVTCLVFGMAIFSRFRAVYRENGDRFVLFFTLAATVLTLGLAVNVIESVVPALALGILAGKSCNAREAANALGRVR